MFNDNKLLVRHSVDCIVDAPIIEHSTSKIPDSLLYDRDPLASKFLSQIPKITEFLHRPKRMEMKSIAPEMSDNCCS